MGTGAAYRRRRRAIDVRPARYDVHMPAIADHPVLMLAVVALVAWILGRFARPPRRAMHEDGHGAVVGLDPSRLADDIAGPMHRTLEQLRREMADIERRRVGADHELVQQVRGLERAASGLATALHSPKARGRWGELHLRRAVELAGMVSHCDFYEQGRHTAPDDARIIQPDLIVRMAGGRCIAVDAKAPMDSWMAAVEATDPAERLERESEHALRVRSHVRELAALDRKSVV